MQAKQKIKKQVNLFLDSGAFSAMTKGVEINIQDYIAFIKEYRKYISVYAVLDVIGDPEATLRNQHIMEDAGLCPLPCFHYGEPLRYLQKYVAEYDYIALGGMARLGARPDMFRFLDDCFDVICDKDGLPKVKVHGFGITTISVMKRYPFYSVDSTSWLIGSRNGQIFVPSPLDDGWDYLEVKNPVRPISISNQGIVDDTHFSRLGRHWQDIVLRWIDVHKMPFGKSEIREVPEGYKLKQGERWQKMPGGNLHFDHGKNRHIEVIIEPGVSNDYQQRDILNARFYKELEGKFPKWPWKWQRPMRQRLGL